jgi:hypothetical protein
VGLVAAITVVILLGACGNSVKGATAPNRTPAATRTTAETNTQVAALLAGIPSAETPSAPQRPR